MSRFLKNPGPKMWGAAKIFAGYLRSRRSVRYHLRRSLPVPGSGDVTMGAYLQTQPTLSTAADAAHNDNGDGTTTIGYLIRIGRSVIMARTLKLKHVTLSTNESELSAQTECGRDLVSFRALLAELGFAQTGPTPMECDSKGAISVAQRQSPTSRTKHIMLRDKWIRQLVASRLAVMVYRRTDQLLAGPLSKPVPGPLFARTRSEMLLTSESVRSDTPASTRLL